MDADVFQKLIADDWDENLREWPEGATSFGYPQYNDRWCDLSAASIARYKESRAQRWQKLQTIDRKNLGPPDQTNYDLFVHDFGIRVKRDRFPWQLLTVDFLINGPNVWIPNTIAIMPAAALRDYENILARLNGSGKLVDDTVAQLMEGIAGNVTQPVCVVDPIPAVINRLLSAPPEQSVFMTAFQRFPETIGDADRTRLRDAAKLACEQTLYPALTRLRDYLLQGYIPNCRTTFGRSELPGGPAWYAFDVFEHANTTLSPAQIHQLGLDEVKRISAEIDSAMRAVGFTGTLRDFLAKLSADTSFFFSTADDLLRGYRDLCKRIDPELPKLFGKLPRTPYGVRPTPEYSAPSEPSARYQRSAADGSRPGYFLANAYLLNTRPKWEMEALALHESVPGHHLQLSLAAELTVLPDFRRNMHLNAYSEGWGLYAESLGEELGFYTDAYSKFGRLCFEIWRAARLVLDTGIHALGWTRAEAVQYMLANTACSEQVVNVEVNRYIAWPGQALSYKIGELKIRELRTKAAQALGSTFDVRKFHDLVLAEGALPLEMLEDRILTWANATA